MHVSVFVFFAGMLVALPEAQTLFKHITEWKNLGLMAFALVVRHLTHIVFLPGFVAKILLLLAAVMGFVRWASPRTFVHKFLGCRFSQFVGKISYSYYFLNVPVLWMLWFIPDSYTPFVQLGQFLGGIFSGLIAALITILLAYFSCRVVELYFINISARIMQFYGK